MEAEEAEHRRQAEEAARRDTPEYCIEKEVELSPKAFAELVSAITYVGESGNMFADEQEEERQHARFRGKRIIVSGKIQTVEETFFTSEVKCIIGAYGRTISARFDGMSKAEAAKLQIGMRVTISGDVSDRLVLSTIALDRCVFE